MFRMLIDTCVWLDLAKDPRQVPVLGAIEEMVKRGVITLIVPRVGLDEFVRNRERIAKESAKSLATHLWRPHEGLSVTTVKRTSARGMISSGV